MELIKKRREEKGLSVEELSVASGVNVGTIRRIERGENCLLDRLEKIADALGLGQRDRASLLGWRSGNE